MFWKRSEWQGLNLSPQKYLHWKAEIPLCHLTSFQGEKHIPQNKHSQVAQLDISRSYHKFKEFSHVFSYPFDLTRAETIWDMTCRYSSLTIFLFFRIIMTCWSWNKEGTRQTLLRIWHLGIEWSSTNNSREYFYSLKIQPQWTFTCTVFSTPTCVPIKFDEWDIPGKKTIYVERSKFGMDKAKEFCCWIPHYRRVFSQCLPLWQVSFTYLAVHVTHGCACLFHKGTLSIKALKL